ncbi:MAG: hypothetical protein MJY82_06035 [Fibrobacter sp.]|nr:hypothetical protein [Fibrobacter sp.]
MPQISPSEIVNKICKESELFDSKDRLLNFSTKGEFQTPLILEAGDLFYEKLAQSKTPLPLDTFLPISQALTAQQKTDIEEQFKTVFREKSEDFLCSDLYMLLGFLKWDGNALAPSLLVPLDVDPEKNTISLSKSGPIENVILRERLLSTITLPTVEEATSNGQFNILLYFSLFEKAILQEKKWKFTRHGLCLAFFDTNRLRLKKRLKQGFPDKQTNKSPFLGPLFSEEGFQFKESVFEEANFNNIFNPADHYFLYPTDSHTSKVMLDALDDKFEAYAIQTVPGTAKAQVAANITAEAIAKGKRTLVVARRAISKQNFCSAFRPMFRSFDGPEREVIEQDLRKTRGALSAYYNAINHSIEPAKAPLSDVLNEFMKYPPSKARIPESVFQCVSSLSLKDYEALKQILEQIVDLYFNQGGIEASRAFNKIKISNIEETTKAKVAAELQTAAAKVQDLKPVIKIFESIGLFPAGIYISGLIDIIDLIQKNFNEDTPEYEDWELRSSNWAAYQDTLKALPEAGDKWVRYRRQTSEIYTENAVDENIFSAREEFAESLKATLKGLSDHYRLSRKRLLSVIKNPKSIESDAQLLDLIDTLIELQENKRAYKDTSVLGNHLLGKDWQFEKSNWVELNKKIIYLYNFREIHKNDPFLELMLIILESWHVLKPHIGEFKKYYNDLQALLASIRNISKDLDLENPLESLSIDKWFNEIDSWNKNWDRLDTHLQLTGLVNQIAAAGCEELAQYAGNVSTINKELAKEFGRYWSGSQIQQVTKNCPELFSLAPKDRYLKGKEYRNQLDQFCNANFRAVHAAVDQNPDLLKILNLDATFNLANEHFDTAILLDADCITVAESLVSTYIADKVILIGDPHSPILETQPFDAFRDALPRQSSFFQENILAAALRRGIATRELWYTSSYSDIALTNFANAKIYNYGIKQYPMPNREKSRSESIKCVSDKVMEIAKAAIWHAEKHPGQTLGIIAFHQARCFEIESAIKALVAKDSPAARFFAQNNPQTRYYIKTPDRAVDKYRDTILVCIDVEGTDKISTERRLSVCTTLAKQDLQVFISESDMEKKAKSNLFWEWIQYLQTKEGIEPQTAEQVPSVLFPQIVEALQSENITVENVFAPGGIPVGPVIVDANNKKRFLAVVEDDCTTERFRESIEDREYVRPTILRQLGWKVLNVWQPFWYMAYQSEKDHMIATIAIEQSVAPPPPENEDEQTDNNVSSNEPDLHIEQYQVLHPKIEGTPHDKPIAELPAASLITQLKFYVDHEAPIHEELLLHRLLELHHVDRAGPMLQQALNDAIKQGFQKQRFIKTGKFFYSIKNPPVVLRDRSMRPDNERKFAYVSPEERALLPASVDERGIKQLLGLLE